MLLARKNYKDGPPNNSYLNPMITNRLREYGVQKLMKLNGEIKALYQILAEVTDNIFAVQRLIANSKPENRKVFEEKLNELYKRSATCIRSIVRKREEAHEIINCNIEGIKADYKRLEFNTITYIIKDKQSIK